MARGDRRARHRVRRRGNHPQSLPSLARCPRLGAPRCACTNRFPPHCMKARILLLVLPLVLALTACGRYGHGETIGYVYAVDDGIVWSKVWYKSTLESSQSDCYLVRDEAIKKLLREQI